MPFMYDEPRHYTHLGHDPPEITETVTHGITT